MAFVTVHPAAGDCPASLDAETVAELSSTETFRTRVMGLGPPQNLYRKALASPGEVFVWRDGKLGQAVVVAPVALEAFWKAVNDDDHHDEGDYIPLRESQVIQGEAARDGRKTFQYFKRSGIGRWWVNRLEMNADLYRSSGGRLWELSWQDVLEEYPAEEPPVEIDDKVPKVKKTLGAWVLVSLAEDCVLVEYSTGGDPGGFLGAFQFLVATRAVKTTLRGMLQIASEHVSDNHPAVRFVRPDGSVLGEDPGV